MTDKKPKRPRDPNQLAKFIVGLATGVENPTAVATSKKLGVGAKGGRARADALTKEERKEIGRIAADARWKKS